MKIGESEMNQTNFNQNFWLQVFKDLPKQNFNYDTTCKREIRTWKAEKTKWKWKEIKWSVKDQAKWNTDEANKWNRGIRWLVVAANWLRVLLNCCTMSHSYAVVFSIIFGFTEKSTWEWRGDRKQAKEAFPVCVFSNNFIISAFFNKYSGRPSSDEFFSPGKWGLAIKSMAVIRKTALSEIRSCYKVKERMPLTGSKESWRKSEWQCSGNA